MKHNHIWKGNECTSHSVTSLWESLSLWQQLATFTERATPNNSSKPSHRSAYRPKLTGDKPFVQRHHQLSSYRDTMQNMWILCIVSMHRIHILCVGHVSYPMRWTSFISYVQMLDPWNMFDLRLAAYIDWVTDWMKLRYVAELMVWPRQLWA